MTYSDLNNPIFQDADKAREYLETQRWPHHVSCPHCGGLEKITKMEGKSHRKGLYLCGDCRGHFSVTVGTVYERSHIPLNKWLLATHLMCSARRAPAPTRCTACWGSPTSPRGSCATVFVRQ